MMDFYQFITFLLHGVAEFLLTEPICYFTAIMLLVCVVGLVKRIIR